jgi:hypothetical protein
MESVLKIVDSQTELSVENCETTIINGFYISPSR